MRTREAIVILIGAWSLATMGGCHDPRAEVASQTRWERIHDYQAQFVAREHEGPQRIAKVEGLIRKFDARYDQRLARDLRRMEAWSQRDIQRWHDRQPRYRADLQDLWDGETSRIPEIIPRMFY